MSFRVTVENGCLRSDFVWCLRSNALKLLARLVQDSRRGSWLLLHFSSRLSNSSAPSLPQPWFLEFHLLNPQDLIPGSAGIVDSRGKKSAAANDEDVDPTQYFENRLKYLAAQLAAGEEPYPHKFPVSMSILEYIEKYGVLSNGEHLEDVTVNLAGRIRSKRSSSSKLFFYDLHGGSVKIQVMADASKSDMNEAEFSSSILM